jgi:uroporphyrinogen-III synthase
MEYKVHILSTRPLSPAILDEAAQNNIGIDIIPFIHTEQLQGEQVKLEITALLEREMVAVFTSMNAVEAVAEHAGSRQPNWKIFCIGDATGTLVRRHFGAGTIAGHAQSAGALADVIVAAGVEEAVFFCGDQRRPELPEKLAASNVSLKEITVYRTIATPAKVEKNYNGILFFSPSAAESFFSVNKVNTYTVLFAIGNTTGDTIRKFTSNAVITSDAPGKEELARNAINYFKNAEKT